MAYQGKYVRQPERRRRRFGKGRALTLLLALVLLSCAVVGTLAWLTTGTDSITNTFTAASVPNTPVEKFDGETKTEIKVKIEGDIAAYVRVKLVTYRVNDAGQHIGGKATIPNFTLGTDWFEKDGYYYYAKPVAPNASSGNLLGSSITLKQYTDADGGKQVIEVLSESIQSMPNTAVESAWPVKVENGHLTAETTKGGSDS